MAVDRGVETILLTIPRYSSFIKIIPLYIQIGIFILITFSSGYFDAV
jgi:hypothetical protein